MATRLCDRNLGHRAHEFVDETGRDHQCPGLRSARSLPELLATRPAVAGVGVGAARVELLVMCA